MPRTMAASAPASSPALLPLANAGIEEDAVPDTAPKPRRIQGDAHAAFQQRLTDVGCGRIEGAHYICTKPGCARSSRVASGGGLSWCKGHDAVWDHMVDNPAHFVDRDESCDAALLFIGKWKDLYDPPDKRQRKMGQNLAKAVRVPVHELRGVPHPNLRTLCVQARKACTQCVQARKACRKTQFPEGILLHMADALQISMQQLAQVSQHCVPLHANQRAE